MLRTQVTCCGACRLGIGCSVRLVIGIVGETLGGGLGPGYCQDSSALPQNDYIWGRLFLFPHPSLAAWVGHHYLWVTRLVLWGRIRP